MIVGVVVLSMFASGRSPKPEAGYEFVARTESRSNLSSAVSMADSSVHGWAAGQAARFEVTASRNPELPTGTFLLSVDGGRTAVFISPMDKSVHPWSLGTPKKAVTSRDRNAAPISRATVRNLKIDRLADEPGKRMDGHATRHFRFRVAYDVSTDVRGDATETSTIRIDDLWTIPDLKLPGTSIWLRRDPPETGDSDVDGRLSDAYAAASGLIVRRVTASKLSGPSGAEQSTRTVWEVSRLRHAAIPPAIFEPTAVAPAVAK